MDEIRKLIDECYWKQDVDGIPICRGEVLPCDSVIDKGKCPILQEYFKHEKEQMRKESE